MIFKYSKNMMMAALLMATAMTVSCKSGENENKDNKGNERGVAKRGDYQRGLEKKNGEDPSGMVSEKKDAGSMEGFERTASGLYYKFERQNPKGKQVQMGDVLYGEIRMKFDDLVVYDNTGNPNHLAQAHPQSVDPLLLEGFMMMHEGDVATFAYDADIMAQMMNGQAPHPNYKPGEGQKLSYRVNLQRIESMEEVQKQQEAEMKKMKKEEPGKIREYVKKNNIKVKPNANGLYIIVNEKGTGEKVSKGKEVTVHYTGRLLDGSVFDSSVERGQPFTFKIGEGQVIEGWDKGLLGQTVGSKLQLIIPSTMSYGDRGAGGHILPYTPLVFDVEIISVK